MGNNFNDIFEKWLDSNPVEDKDKYEVPPQSQRNFQLSRKQLREMPSQSSLDLHGKTAEEARTEVRSFLQESLKRGYKKVLIIHGKGYHSENQGVLRKVVYSELDSSPYTGERGVPPKREGGAGAVWVILRKE